MNILELNEKYKNVPEELKVLRRWVCYKEDKVPLNSINGKPAKSSDQSTWSTFSSAIRGCAKYECLGIGFMLGNGIFGVDLDDGAYKEFKKNKITQEEYNKAREEFEITCDEFIATLNSYTEKSMSGRGYHIICYGKLPEGRRRKGQFEMYDSGRYFAFTGDAVNNIPIQNREEEIKPLWNKYVNEEESIKRPQNVVETPIDVLELEDEELIKIILKSSQKAKFEELMDGYLDSYGNDHSSADQALCNILAFWTAKNKEQMDRIFRTSKLMRNKWDEYRGKKTYGEITLDRAISQVVDVFIPQEKEEDESYLKARTYFNEDSGQEEKKFVPNMNLDENFEPIFKIKKIFKSYTLDDTGNAQRFYDYFGENFHYNVTDKIFMYWTGKTWIRDDKDIIKKYANKLIEIMRQEADDMEQHILKLTSEGEVSKAALQEDVLKSFRKNITRVSNKAGKDAMISEFKSLKQIPITSSQLNVDNFLLNTSSGVVDLKSGNTLPFDNQYLISKNTNNHISFKEPKNWVKFLESIFYRGDTEEQKKETEDIISFVKKALGYSLTGSCSEQVMFILYGDGSNGKSTFLEQISNVVGEYAASIDANILMQNKAQNNSSISFSLAKLMHTRMVITGETEENGRLAESRIKALTGDETINAQFKFGNEFSFKPNFKIWMATNHKPIIRGTDYGIWRRIVPIPFIRIFDKHEKDRKMPDKLRAETAEILGWCITGALEYYEDGQLDLPECLEKERDSYRKKMNVVSQFMIKECVLGIDYSVNAKTLFQAYKSWSQDNIEFSMKQSKFEEELFKNKITVFKRGGERWYRGIGLVSPYQPSYSYNNKYDYNDDDSESYIKRKDAYL